MKKSGVKIIKNRNGVHLFHFGSCRQAQLDDLFKMIFTIEGDPQYSAEECKKIVSNAEYNLKNLWSISNLEMQGVRCN